VIRISVGKTLWARKLFGAFEKRAAASVFAERSRQIQYPIHFQTRSQSPRHPYEGSGNEIEPLHGEFVSKHANGGTQTHKNTFEGSGVENAQNG